MRPLPSPATLFAAAVAIASLRAEPYDARQWRFRQDLTVDEPGLVKVALPVETLDAARADLADLRLLDPAGAEVPFALERTARPTFRVVSPESLSGSVEDAATVYVIKTGTADEIGGLQIDAGQQTFMTRVLVEASDDGREWRELARNRPVFNREGDVKMSSVDFPAGSHAWLRLTVDKLDGARIALRGVRLLARPPETDQPVPAAVRIAARDETPGETRLTLVLPGANLPVAALELATPEPVFNRPVRLAYRALVGDAIQEVTLLQAAISRRGPDDRPATLAVEQSIPSREAILIVDNGDSPPLAVTAVAAWRRPVFAVFYAAAGGSFTLASGNPRAAAPRYDVSALAEPARQANAARLTPGALQANPAFQPGEALPGIATLGTPLSIEPWAYRRPVRISAAGVQQLELPPGVLARAQRGLADLRLLSGDRQVPFIVERTSLTRPLAVEAVAVPDPKQPGLSRWRLTLPEPRLPLRRLTATVATPLFRRDLRLLEDVEDERGQVTRRWLGQAAWNQTPERRTTVFAITFNDHPETASLWLETDNGDNPPIALAGVRVHYEVTRLLFKAAPDLPLFLCYGNPRAAAPRYDLSLVGGQLLAADKSGAELGDEEALKDQSFARTVALAGRSGLLFWGILGLVVVVLLVVIARLLPKAPSSDGRSL